MLRKSGIIFVMLIAVAIMVTASASAVSADTTQKTGTNGWVVTPSEIQAHKLSRIYSTGVSSSSISTLSAANVFSPGVNYIIQGQTSGTLAHMYLARPEFTVDLNWGNSANSLQLTVFAPDGSVLGPYYDSADGRMMEEFAYTSQKIRER